LLSSCGKLFVKSLSGGNYLNFKTMTLKKSTSLAFVALAVSFCIGCSSKEDREKYDYYYGSGSKVREEAALVALQNERRNQPEPVRAPATTSPAASGTETGKTGDSTSAASSSGSAEGTTGAAAAGTATGAAAAGAAPAGAAPAANAAPKRKPIPADVSALLNKHACLACHQAYDKVIGPAYAEVAKRKYSADQIVELVHAPKPEHWPGYPPMAPFPQVPKAEIVVIANWINSL
jgi:cytochrome c551/c552